MVVVTVMVVMVMTAIVILMMTQAIFDQLLSENLGEEHELDFIDSEEVNDSGSEVYELDFGDSEEVNDSGFERELEKLELDFELIDGEGDTFINR